MKFDSFADFMAMGGHGVFVWSVYAITFVVLVSLAVAPLRRRRRFWVEQSMRLKREQQSLQQDPIQQHKVQQSQNQ